MQVDPQVDLRPDLVHHRPTVTPMAARDLSADTGRLQDTYPLQCISSLLCYCWKRAALLACRSYSDQCVFDSQFPLLSRCCRTCMHFQPGPMDVLMMDAASVYEAREWLQRLFITCSTCNPAEQLLSPLREPKLTVRDRLEALRSSRGLQQAQSLMLHLQVMIVNRARTLAAQARQRILSGPVSSIVTRK